MRFTQFIPNIENVPFSDVEACNILNINEAVITRASKQGLIQKTVEIHYRFDISFKFLNLFDIFEYALRSNLSFLNYGTHPEVSELIYGLVDEMAFIIDNCLYSNLPPTMNRIKNDLELLCRDDAEKWNEYWLCDGDPFSAKKCAAITIQTWCNVFEKTMTLVSPLEEYLGDPYKERSMSNGNFVGRTSDVKLTTAIIQ
ncbi:hypothetical protein [Profundibacter sp.]